MPFEHHSDAPRKIAVIGGGISGMGAAYLLSGKHNVTLFEAEPRLGGHARTIVAGKNGDQPVDTGFLVFNYANYPLMGALFHELGVPIAPSSMSFGASIDGGKLEYGLASFGAIFAQKRNLADPRFLRMIRDILHFNAHAFELAQANRDLSIGQFLDKLGTGAWFRDYYLFPLSGAIWSTPTHKMLDFPAYAMIQFFENHALLHHSGQHQWHTVDGGSVEYVTRLQAAMVRRGTGLRLGTPVHTVKRDVTGVLIKTADQDWEHFDEVVLGTHSDDSLRLLSDPKPHETKALGAVKYQRNEVVLHCDAAVMPTRRKVWSSWNYTEDKDTPSDQIDLTYWLNSLQPIPQNDPHFVTLNSKRQIREELIYDQTVLRHPVYDLGALQAQDEVRAFNGTNHTWFCGAWMRNGFHEDGLASALEVVDAMENTTSALRVAQ